jgi:hypothetical protein
MRLILTVLIFATPRAAAVIPAAPATLVVYYSLRIYALTPGLNMLEALTRNANTSRDLGYAIEISDDWRTVTEYRFRPATDSWNSLKFCLTGRTYRSCGENSKSPPPKHPLLDPNQ